MPELLVANAFVGYLGDVAQVGGLSAAGIFPDRRCSPARALEAPAGHVPWVDLVSVVERMADAVGGYWALERLSYRAVQVHPMMRNAASLFGSARDLYLVGLERLSRRLCRGLGQRAEDLPDGRLRCELRIPADQPDCPAYQYIHHGTLRAYPRLYGQPDPSMSLDLQPRRGVFHVTLADDRRKTNTGRLLRTLTPRPLPGTGDDYGDGLPPGQELLPLLADPGLAAEIADLGSTWLAAGSLALLSQSVYRFLQDRFCCDHATLSITPVRGAEEVVVFSRGRADAPLPWRRALVVGDREVGALAADVACFPDGQVPPLLEAALPWIGLAVEQTLRRPSSPLPGVQTALDLRPLIARRAEDWQLTPREAEALALLVDGQSNRQIAEAMGCSLKTVEAHVSQVLHKAGAPGRSALVNLLLESRLPPTYSR